MNCLTRIMNPTTVIAIFAGLSEASAATVMPYLDGETRQLYLWFLIVFPSALVFMFFLTLNFNNTALYPPTGSCCCLHTAITKRRSEIDRPSPGDAENMNNMAPQCAVILEPEVQSKSANFVGSGDSRL